MSRRWSPKFGIMKLLIDHWHYESLDAKLVSLLRVGLQGYDTLVHVASADLHFVAHVSRDLSHLIC